VKQTVSTEIELERPAVVALFEDRMRHADSQAPFLRQEPQVGIAGESGARSELKYTRGTKEAGVIETVIENSLPDLFRAQHVYPWGSADVTHRFQALSNGRTRWVMDVDFRSKGFIGLLMRFMPGMPRGFFQQLMFGFKTYAENHTRGDPGPE